MTAGDRSHSSRQSGSGRVSYLLWKTRTLTQYGAGHFCDCWLNNHGLSWAHLLYQYKGRLRYNKGNLLLENMVLSQGRCNKRERLQAKRKIYCFSNICSECDSDGTPHPTHTKPTSTLWQEAVTQDPQCSSASTAKAAARGKCYCLI